MLIASVSSGRQLMPEPLKSQGLQYHFSGPREGGQENAFAPEDCGPNAAYHLDVVVDSGLEGNQVSGLGLHLLARPEIEFHEVAAGMNEYGAGASKLFKDKALAAEQSRS